MPRISVPGPCEATPEVCEICECSRLSRGDIVGVFRTSAHRSSAFLFAAANMIALVAPRTGIAR